MLFRSLQVGGEFLFEDARLVWCHRMQGIHDQTEMNVIKRVLDLPLYEADEVDDEVDDDGEGGIIRRLGADVGVGIDVVTVF